MDTKELEKDFEDNKEHYKTFQDEIQDFVRALKKKHDNVLDIADIKQRPNNEIKSFASIKQNIEAHNKYSDCKSLFDIKDIAGVRVTCHCEEDAENFATLLEGELSQKYTNVKKIDKGGVANSGKSHPAYRAIHLNCSKATSDGKDIYCEIQLRTIMADAWAVQDRKYIYGKNIEGDAHELTTAVSQIMNGCETLWGLVKKKSLGKGGLDIKDEIAKIIKEADMKLSTNKKTEQDIKATAEWFTVRKKIAFEDLKKAKIPGFLEVMVDLPTTKIILDKKILKEAAESSLIHTFGWPIGVFLPNRPEFSIKPDSDGIYTKILFEDRESYDYWSINTNASFYLLKSLFEDSRKQGHIFFNTRIVRITEFFLYLRNLYTKLDIPPNAVIKVTIKHGGLKGRILSSSSANRSLSREYKFTETEDEISTPITTSLRSIETNLADNVEQITKPMFELFEFFSLSRNVLAEIVTNYTHGIIT